MKDGAIMSLRDQHRKEVQNFIKDHAFPCANKEDLKESIRRRGYSTYKYMSKFLEWTDGVYMKTEYLDPFNNMLNRQRDEMSAHCGDPYITTTQYTGTDYNPFR